MSLTAIQVYNTLGSVIQNVSIAIQDKYHALEQNETRSSCSLRQRGTKYIDVLPKSVTFRPNVLKAMRHRYIHNIGFPAHFRHLVIQF